MKVGDRVITQRGEIGYIEKIIDDGLFADVRYLTPNNTPSCCVGLCFLDTLKTVGDNVVPMPRNAEWWQEAKEFLDVILDSIGENP